MQTTKTLQPFTNHLALILDASSSMGPLRKDVIRVVNSLVEKIRKQSVDLGQETRLTLVTFSSRGSTTFHSFDMDVMRPFDLSTLYRASGNTALIDAVANTLVDLSTISQKHGDHAFLTYLVTDGEENCSLLRADQLAATIEKLADNWTLAALVPNKAAQQEVGRCGIYLDNTKIWNTTAVGLQQASNDIEEATSRYMIARATGIKSTKNLFQMDLSGRAGMVGKKDSGTQELNPRDYTKIKNCENFAQQIRPLVEENIPSESYRIGSAYYQLVKTETIQAGKALLIVNEKSGKVFYGAGARALVSLPDYDVKVAPATIKGFSVYVQSTSVNRNIIPGQSVIVVDTGVKFLSKNA